MARFKDRADRDMVLAMTHEEIVTDLARAEISSYRQLPMIVYQLQTKFRDEPRARGGLIRGREFTMKDSYSLDADEAGSTPPTTRTGRPTSASSAAAGSTFVVVGADTGMMGGTASHEFMALSPNGEDTLLICPNVRLRRQPRGRHLPPRRRPAEEPLPMEEVATPTRPPSRRSPSSWASHSQNRQGRVLTRLVAAASSSP